jgi:hypothetical protein
MMKNETSATTLQLLGAGSFGAVMGWGLYYLNRYREKVLVTDLAAIVGVIGGAAILTLFPAKTDLFGAYAIGLGAGFFGYFIVLVAMVAKSPTVTVDWFLSGSPADRGRVMDHDQGLNP